MAPTGSSSPLSQGALVGLAVGLLLFIALGTAGSQVAQGVVEEKATRIMEVLLATIQPSRLLAGKVIGSGNTDLTCPGASYGNWILVQHDNGLTSVYGHLSLVTAKVGDIVQTGQTIAYSGMTGYATGPHVHLTIFVSSAVKVTQMPSKACVGKIYTQPIAPISAFLDPMLYLPPIEPSMKYY